MHGSSGGSRGRAKTRFACLGIVGLGAWAGLTVAAGGEAAQGPPVRPPDHWAVLGKYCTECHNTEDWAGGVAFDALSPTQIPQDAQPWEKAIRKLSTGMMPPPGKPRPPRAVLEDLASELTVRLDQSAVAHPMAAAIAPHRLNRAEYANAVRDLLALNVDATTLLPADDAGEGFDNIADVLSVSPTLVQAYIEAAMKVSRRAVGERSMAPVTVKYRAPSGTAQHQYMEGQPLGSRGGLRIEHNFPLDAEYEFRVSAGSGFRFAGPDGGPPPVVTVTLDGQPIGEPDSRKFRVQVKAGPQLVGVALAEKAHSTGVDDLYSKAQPRRDDLEDLTIVGPFNPSGPGQTLSRRAIFQCYPHGTSEESACARLILTRLATHAFRRPLEASDPSVEMLMRFYTTARQSGSFEEGVRAAVARLLADPQFLYRIEAPVSQPSAQALEPVSDIDLASRLSFFLWSSIPDDTLIQLATSGRLSHPQVLQEQVRRMLADPRSAALEDNFTSQWLRLRELAAAQPADPDFDDSLRQGLLTQTQLLFGHIMHQDRSLLELLDADYTFVNERIAKHYGIANVHGAYMRQVPLASDSPRRGLLGQGSILTVTSAGDRTSPVQRGAWVMETLFGAPVPQPPPGTDQNLKDGADLSKPMTVRQRLELHRANPTCAACHRVMDPIGFSLEHFDLDGRWRERDGDNPIDSTGTLVDGTVVNGVTDLRRALRSRSDAFMTSLTERLLTYALGRRIEYYDQPAIRTILRDSKKTNFKFSDVVIGVVESTPFRMKGGTPLPVAPLPPLRQANLASSNAQGLP